jgi:hypothetical protein
MFAFVCFTGVVIQRKANITMAKSHKPNKGKHYNGKKLQAKQRQASQWPKAVNQTKANITAIVMFAFLWITAFGHCDVCFCLLYGFWPL